MNYCSLEDAFQMAPGNEYSPRAARRDERKKAKKCKGPLLTFMESQGLIDEKDPDRQHLERPKDIQAMNPNTGLRAHVPSDAPLGMEPFQNDDFPGNAGAGPESVSKLPVRTCPIYYLDHWRTRNKMNYSQYDQHLTS